MRYLSRLSAICVAVGVLSAPAAALAVTQEEAAALVAERYGVAGIPTVIVFDAGTEIRRTVRPAAEELTDLLA